MNGYLYIAYGEEHVNEAKASLQSLRQVDKSAHVTIITTKLVPGFDQVIIRKSFRPGFSGKVDNLTNKIYNKTLFVDTDTYFCENCSGLFDLLNHYDVCVMPDPGEPALDHTGFTSYNTGVVLFRQNDNVSKFIELFQKYYNDDALMEKVLKNHPAGKFRTDQPAFSLATRDSNVKLYPLSSIWNARYRFNINLMGSVKLIHGPATNYEKLRTLMNYDLGNRIWTRDLIK